MTNSGAEEPHMSTLPVAAFVAQPTLDEALSALPDAPVVGSSPNAPTRRLVSVRLSLATALRRAADRVTPAECLPA
jgi:hypothetical protein